MVQILVMIHLKNLSGGNRKSFCCCFISALAFKNAKQFDQAKDACLREAVAHENNRAYLFKPLKGLNNSIILTDLLHVEYNAIRLKKWLEILCIFKL